MGQIKDSEAIAADPADVWRVVGDFQGFHRWHPGVTASAAENEGRRRRLTTLDGAVIVEDRLPADSERTYRYAIVESGLPMTRHQASLSVEPGPGGSVLRWECEFDARSSDAEGIVTTVLGQVIRSGLEAVAATFTDRRGAQPA
jgi:carbon monoxide dehydrogenase subunit G